MDSRLAALRRLIEGLAPQLELDLAIRHLGWRDHSARVALERRSGVGDP